MIVDATRATRNANDEDHTTYHNEETTMAKRTENTATADPKTPTTAADTAELPLKKICAELGIDPKAARRRLRKVWRKEGSDLEHVVRERWTGERLRAILAPTKH